MKNKKEKYESLKQLHISENGTAPDAFAVTEMIKEAIENKSYRTYKGGGFYDDGSKEIGRASCRERV